jgi:hypothetical protein
MTAPDAPERREITTAESGITVSKTVDTERFPVPAIVFEIRSDRATPATLRLLDVIPGDVSAEDLGFHDEFGIEFWTIEGNAAVFEREFDPGKEYRTVYGVRSADTETVERFLTEPEISVESSDSGPSDAEGLEAEHPDAGGPETDEPPADDSPVSAATADDTAAVLAARIRRGTIADADVATLRDALDERTERLETDTTGIDAIDTDATETDTTGVDTAGTDVTDIDTTEPAGDEPALRADEPTDRSGSSDAAVERSTSRLVTEQEYRIVSEHPPADLTNAEIEAELRDIAALSDRERREYKHRDHDVEQRGRELFGELEKRSADTD